MTMSTWRDYSQRRGVVRSRPMGSAPGAWATNWLPERSDQMRSWSMGGGPECVGRGQAEQNCPRPDTSGQAADGRGLAVPLTSERSAGRPGPPASAGFGRQRRYGPGIKARGKLGSNSGLGRTARPSAPEPARRPPIARPADIAGKIAAPRPIPSPLREGPREARPASETWKPAPAALQTRR